MAVRDLGRGKAFFSDTLGLTQVAGEGDFYAAFESGGTRVNVYPSQFAGTAKSTVATFVVSDLEAAMAALRQKGVTFEEYDITDGPKTVNGVAEAAGVRSAWFKDPDGNTYAVSQIL